MVEIKMHIHVAPDCICNFYLDYILALFMASCEDILHPKLLVTIKHIMSRLKPPSLKARIGTIILLKKPKNFNKKDFDVFMRKVPVQAEKLQLEMEPSLTVFNETTCLLTKMTL